MQALPDPADELGQQLWLHRMLIVLTRYCLLASHGNGIAAGTVRPRCQGVAGMMETHEGFREILQQTLLGSLDLPGQWGGGRGGLRACVWSRWLVLCRNWVGGAIEAGG